MSTFGNITRHPEEREIHETKETGHAPANVSCEGHAPRCGSFKFREINSYRTLFTRLFPHLCCVNIILFAIRQI